jgi:antitoxin component YwqK of YwqJK toxin-antitoxin module
VKDFIKNLTSSWVRAVGLIIFLIILNGTLMEWTAVNFPTEYHQTGWQFVGMIMLASVIIPASLLVTGLISLWRKQKPKAKLFFWTAVVLLLGWVGPIWIKNFERITEVYILPENLEEQRGCVIRGSRTIEEKDGLHYVSYSSACRQAIGELFTGVHLVYEPNIIKIGQKMIIEKHTYEAGVLLKSERSSFCGDVITDGLFESKCEDDHVKGAVKNNKLEGTWLRFHENGNMSQRITYRNDLMHGTHETFSDSGEIQIKENYKDGKLVGSKEYFSHENGESKSKGNYKDGKKVGLWEFYHENGESKSKGNYKDGKKEGLWEFYRENGNIWDRVTYRNDLMHGTLESFYDSGEINWRRDYKDGELHGRWESFFKDGKTNILSNWKNGKELNQTRFTYYGSGKLRQKGEFKGDKPNGLYERFYENGQLKETGNYQDGKQDGLWKGFDEEGNPTKTGEF